MTSSTSEFVIELTEFDTVRHARDPRCLGEPTSSSEHIDVDHAQSQEAIRTLERMAMANGARLERSSTKY